MKPLGKNLVFFGHIGLDVYIGEDRTRIRDAGSAFNVACGVAGAGAEAACIATLGPRSHPNALRTLEQYGVRLLLCPTLDAGDHVFVFETTDPKGENRLSRLSLAGGDAALADQIPVLPFDDYHFHIGSMPLDSAVALAARIKQQKPRSSVSCTLYAHHLERPREWADLLDRCDLVFMNDTELERMRADGCLERCAADRLLVVTGGAAGAVAFVDGVPTISHTPPSGPVRCTVGAGDVFAGAFLGRLCRWRDLADAIVVAVDLAAVSVRDFGVEHVIGERASKGVPRSGIVRPNPQIPLAPLESFSFTTSREHETRDATGLFVRRGGKLLLATKPPEKAFVPGVLYVPGGKLESGETPEQCAERELHEETTLHGGKLAYCGSSVFWPDGSSRRVYRFLQFRVDDPVGEASASDDICGVGWHREETLGRSDLFDLTWAQLWLDKFLGPVLTSNRQPAPTPTMIGSALQQLTVHRDERADGP